MGKKKYQEYWNYIQDHNKGRHDSTKEKLYTRVLSARSRWAKKHDLDKEDIDKLIKSSLGEDCPYCGEEVTTENMSLDHIKPQAQGGKNTPENLQIIDQKCNTRKSTISDKDFRKLMKTVNELSEESQAIILRKLSAKLWY